MRLRCVECRRGMLEPEKRGLECPDCRAVFPHADGRPILLRSDNAIFRTADYLGATKGDRRRGLARFIPDPSVNLVRNDVLTRLDALLAPDAVVLVVGAGDQRGQLDGVAKRGRTVVCVDVDPQADVDMFCDGHELPFPDGSVDAVLTTAVLEHVMYPERVAAEIARVVRLGGVLYSELPFMQQVHMGAYDFTRYTLSGHRRLFKQFGEIESGMVAGPATALTWAIENLALAFLRGRRRRALTKAAVRLSLFWLPSIDRLLARRPEALDGASCTYLLARREAEPVHDRVFITRYAGALM